MSKGADLGSRGDCAHWARALFELASATDNVDAGISSPVPTDAKCKSCGEEGRVHT
jgi:hypothetical protein